MTTETFDDKTAFLAALHGRTTKRARSNDKAAQNGAGDVTAGAMREQSERTGLWTLIRQGWNVETPDSVRYRLWKGALRYRHVRRRSCGLPPRKRS